MGSIQVLHRRYLGIEESPPVKLLSIFMPLMVDRDNNEYGVKKSISYQKRILNITMCI